MSGIEARRSCRGLFQKLDILPVSYQYILALMLFVKIIRIIFTQV